MNSSTIRVCRKNSSPGMNGEKQWDTRMIEVIEWLESAEGEEWSFQHHRYSREYYNPWLKTCSDNGSWIQYVRWEIEYAQNERELIPAESGAAT